MKNLLFNSHDIVLALVIALCLVQAVRAISGPASMGVARGLVALFLVLNALVALDTLLFWGDGIKHAAFDVSPWLPMFFSFASFAVGPVLYWLCRSQIYPHHARIRRSDYLQLLPALATPLYLYWACYRFPMEQQHDLILELKIFSRADAYFLVFLTLKKLAPVIYGVLSVLMMIRAMAQSRKLPRVLQLHGGFVFIWLWVLMTHVLGQWLPMDYSDLMGILGNYISLVLITAIFFSGAERPLASERPISKATEGEEPPENAELIALSEQIHQLILSEKPYLNPRLTLERFAALLDAPPRQVSCAINRCFQQNFHEYINRFRIEEAKRLLRAPECQGLNIQEVAVQSGFNSKATFHRFFKSLVGVTPSAFRNPHLVTELVPQESH